MAYARNEVRNSDAKVCPTTTVKKVIAYVEMVATHCLKPSQPPRCAAPKQIKKGAPGPSDLVYINVDAVIFKSYSSSAIGVLFRNHMGTRLLACRKSFCGITEVAEALTLRRAVVLTLDQDFHMSIIVVWKVRDSRLAATSSTVGHGAPSHPDVAHVLLSTVDGVGLSGQATSPSGRRGLTCRPLRPVQGRGTVTSLTPRGHVWRLAFDRGVP
ncbi:hypothetical protein PVAP13_7KG271965 [Panicum virgatum]|uniref:Uncharacterized protein n=1 Tax=Panicum virgatum TaxID=38727 RepID=A0A8T0QE26_PANVG|nr:hypothetical protein PVAP13_7KG271965 [Panicum virgatum]